MKLDKPSDLREQIRLWLAEVCDTGKLPFENGGIVVQLLNCWLRCYEVEKMTDLEARIEALEARQ